MTTKPHNRIMEIKFRAFDDGQMIYSDSFQDERNYSEYDYLKFFFEGIRGDAIVMQFTGQLDKNGAEIYLGDIIRTKKRVGVVKFSHGGYNIDGWAISFLSEHHEVIGNVYQNGDLIQ